MPYRPSLARTIGILLALCSLCAASPEELATVAEVRALSRADEFTKHPVRLQGVVISDLSGGGMFLQDDTASIWLEGDDELFQRLERGDLVEARGMSAPGKFAPIVVIDLLTKLGTAPIPDPVRVTYADLRSGSYDAQWVEIDGIVRRAAGGYLDLATGGDRLRLFFKDENDGILPVDSRIRVQGVAMTQFTRNGQIMYPVVAVQSGMKPTVIAPPPSDPPLRRIDRLMAFSDRLDHEHRFRIQGMVTYQRPGEAIWLEENDHGIRVKFNESTLYKVGEVIEVVGFPVRGQNYAPEMEDVTVKRIAVGNPRPPVLLPSTLDALHHDAELVSLQVELVGFMQVPQGLRFVLRDKHRDFIAQLVDANIVIPPEWQPGSIIRVTGICGVSSATAADYPGTVHPREFRIIVRSPADIQVLRTPPWWNAERRSWLFAAITALLVLVALGIFWFSRRRLRQAATARRQAEAEFSAILGERNRIAREIHDTIAQGLGAISLQHEMLKDHLPPGSRAESHLVEANEITHDCLREARESIWNMRSQVLEKNDLATALAGILDQLTDCADLEVGFDLRGSPFRLPPVVENNLLRIGQEAITNAVKHAAAKHLDVIVDYSPHQVTLRVKDDGRGFDPASVEGDHTHFGLIGLRERSNELRAAIHFKTSLGHGTEVVLEYPVSKPGSNA